MFTAGETLAMTLSWLFVGYAPELLEMTAHAFMIFSFSFLCSGFTIYGSSFFTALGDGFTSALISFLHVFAFQCTAVLLFPVIWKLDGIWVSIPAAEAMATAVTVLFLAGKKKRYHY